MWETIGRDIRSSARSNSIFWRLQAIYLSPGLTAVMIFRLQDFFYTKKMLPLAYFVHRINLTLHGIDILPGARIGGGLRIDHPSGVVIGAGVIVGADCIILQNVTLGAKYVERNKFVNEFPKIGDSVVIGAGAVVLGGIEVGNNCVVGANSVVLADVATGKTVSGVHK